MKAVLVFVVSVLIWYWCWPWVTTIQHYLSNNFAHEVKAEESRMKMRDIRKEISELDSEMSTMVRETEQIMSSSPRTQTARITNQFLVESAGVIGEVAAAERVQLVEGWSKEKDKRDLQILKSARKTALRTHDQELSP